MKNTNHQLELGFNQDRAANFAPQHRQQKLHRAKWWFAQMRRAVDAAVDWQPAPPPRAEQAWLVGARQDIRALAQHQICE